MLHYLECPPFRGRYRHCITFTADADLAPVLGWLTKTHPRGIGDLYDGDCEPRRLYAIDDDLAVLVKLRWSDRIARIDEAVGHSPS